MRETGCHVGSIKSLAFPSLRSEKLVKFLRRKGGLGLGRGGRGRERCRGGRKEGGMGRDDSDG